MKNKLNRRFYEKNTLKAVFINGKDSFFIPIKWQNRSGALTLRDLDHYCEISSKCEIFVYTVAIFYKWCTLNVEENWR